MILLLLSPFPSVLLTAIVIGFELTSNIASESVGMIDLCAVIFDGSLERNVDVVLATQPGTAQGERERERERESTLTHTDKTLEGFKKNY